MSINAMILTGRLAQEPEVKVTQNGQKVMNFSLAWKDSWGKKDTVDFFPCVAYEATAEFIKRNFGKGDEINVCGRLIMRRRKTQEGKEYGYAMIQINEVHPGRYKKSAANPIDGRDDSK